MIIESQQGGSAYQPTIAMGGTQMGGCGYGHQGAQRDQGHQKTEKMMQLAAMFEQTLINQRTIMSKQSRQDTQHHSVQADKSLGQNMEESKTAAYQEQSNEEAQREGGRQTIPRLQEQESTDGKATEPRGKQTMDYHTSSKRKKETIHQEEEQINRILQLLEARQASKMSTSLNASESTRRQTMQAPCGRQDRSESEQTNLNQEVGNTEQYTETYHNRYPDDKGKGKRVPTERKGNMDSSERRQDWTHHGPPRKGTYMYQRKWEQHLPVGRQIRSDGQQPPQATKIRKEYEPYVRGRNKGRSENYNRNDRRTMTDESSEERKKRQRKEPQHSPIRKERNRRTDSRSRTRQTNARTEGERKFPPYPVKKRPHPQENIEQRITKPPWKKQERDEALRNKQPLPSKIPEQEISSQEDQTDSEARQQIQIHEQKVVELQNQLREQQEQLQVAHQENEWRKVTSRRKSRKDTHEESPTAIIQTTNRFAALRDNEGSSTDQRAKKGESPVQTEDQKKPRGQKVFWSGAQPQIIQATEKPRQHMQTKKGRPTSKGQAEITDAYAQPKNHEPSEYEELGTTQDSQKMDIITPSQTEPQGKICEGKGPQIVPLSLKYVKSNFSEAERAFFAAAALEGKVSQTHFVNPEATMCHRRPICDKTLNPGGLTKNTVRHFLRMHNTPYREYVVTIDESTNRKIHIKTGNIAAQRAGAEPPSGLQTMELADPTEAKRGTKTIQQQKAKLKTSKKRARPKHHGTKPKKKLAKIQEAKAGLQNVDKEEKSNIPMTNQKQADETEHRTMSDATMPIPPLRKLPEILRRNIEEEAKKTQQEMQKNLLDKEHHPEKEWSPQREPTQPKEQKQPNKETITEREQETSPRIKNEAEKMSQEYQQRLEALFEDTDEKPDQQQQPKMRQKKLNEYENIREAIKARQETEMQMSSKERKIGKTKPDPTKAKDGKWQEEEYASPRQIESDMEEAGGTQTSQTPEQ